MIGLQRIDVEGKRFVLLPETEYERLCREAGEAAAMADEEMPALPKPDKHGRFPALQYARISLARPDSGPEGRRPESTTVGRPGRHPTGNLVEDRNRKAYGHAGDDRQDHARNRGQAAAGRRSKARVAAAGRQRKAR